MKKEKDPNSVIQAWLERDLSDEAAKGLLPQAFEVGPVCEQISDILSSGRSPVLTGESGIGKTAVVYELARQVAAGCGPEVLRGKRIIQISLRRRASALKTPQTQMRPEMQTLVEELISFGGQITPFIRDIHLAYHFDLEPHLQSLAFQLPSPVLAEGDSSTLREMFEAYPELEHHYVTVVLEEPSLKSALRILRSWCEAQTKSTSVHYTDPAIEEALFLTHRFLSRDRLPRKAIDLLLQAGSMGASDKLVKPDDVLNRFCTYHRIPRFLVDPSIPLELSRVEDYFQTRVLGQDEAVSAVVQMVGLIKAGLSDMRRPFGAFLFVGPTGVGKTHLAQFLAEYLFGSSDRIIRLNMADYSHEADAKLLFGDPEADNVSRRRGFLTQRVAGHPFAVMLLDEFEKAHSKVHDRFLQLIDEGAFINGTGESVSCRSMIIIATSNTGARVYRGHAIGFGQYVNFAEMDKEVDRCLESQFRFEFLNRFDRIVHFHPLSREHIRTISQRELERLKNRPGLRQRNLRLDVDESVLDWLAAHGYDPDYGARFLRRIIERHVTTALAEAIVKEGTPVDLVITLDVRRNRIRAALRGGTAEHSRRQTVKLPLGTEEKTKSLDFSNLLTEGEVLLKAAEKRLDELEVRKAKARQLLDQMQEPAFWLDETKKRDAIEVYRSLDVAIRFENRLAEPLLNLADAYSNLNNQAISPSALSQLVERAARSLREWDERLAEDGISEVWMIISNADPLQQSGTFIKNLASMELAWCRKLELSAAIVAYGTSDGELSRVALEIEGPGASNYLAMEQGLHRQRRTQGEYFKARLEIRPHVGNPSSNQLGVRPIRKRKGLFGLELSFAGKLRFPDRGISIEWVGTDKSTLAEFLGDLEYSATQTLGEPETARIYGEAGVVRDPRTGVASSYIKDVWKGNLDKFLQGWRLQRSFGV